MTSLYPSALIIISSIVTPTILLSPPLMPASPNWKPNTAPSLDKVNILEPSAAIGEKCNSCSSLNFKFVLAGAIHSQLPP